MNALVQTVAPTAEPVSLEEAKWHLRIDTDDNDYIIEGLIKAAREHAEAVLNRALLSQTWCMYLEDWPDDEDYIEIPYPPLQSITSIIYTDYNGALNTWTVATDSTGDTTLASATITGMTDTSDFDVGDIVTVSAGFPTTTLQIESKTATTIVLNNVATSTQANVTVTTATNYLEDTKSEPGRVVLAYGADWPTATLYPMNPIAITYVCGYSQPDDVPQSIKQAMMIDIADMYEQREGLSEKDLKVLPVVMRLLAPYMVHRFK